jgi:hypothetical protein
VERVFSLPTQLKPGIFELRLALVDETGKPQLRLTIEGVDARLRYRLGSVTITQSK